MIRIADNIFAKYLIRSLFNKFPVFFFKCFPRELLLKYNRVIDSQRVEHPVWIHYLVKHLLTVDLKVLP